MTFDEVGAPARLSGGPSPATNIPVVHTLLIAIQSTFDLEQEEPRKRYEKNGGSYSNHLRPKIIQIGPVVQTLEQFSRCKVNANRLSFSLRNCLVTTTRFSVEMELERAILQSRKDLGDKLGLDALRLAIKKWRS